MLLRSRLGIAATVVALCGCGSQPIPMAVVEGTTATITIPGKFEVGYGRAWARNPAAAAPPYDYTENSLAPFRSFSVSIRGPVPSRVNEVRGSKSA